MQRVFWNRIALAAGWQLDWRPVHGDVNDRASRAAADQRDLGPLHAMFDQIVTPAPPARNRDKSWRGQVAAEAESNGIPAVRELLKAFAGVAGAVFTI